MSKYFKAIGATALVVVPLLIKQWATTPWDIVTLGGFAIVVFLSALKIFKPDQRFQLVRKPFLDSTFGETFEDDFEHASTSQVKTPFRAYVFTPKRKLFLCFFLKFLPYCAWRRTLCVTYAYNSNTSHADHGHVWQRNHGLVWQAFLTGDAQFAMQGDAKWKSCGLTAEEDKATSHVEAVFAIPLRKPAKSEEDTVSSKVHAVLSLDALTKEAADVLSQQYELFKKSAADSLLDRAQLVSLFV